MSKAHTSIKYKYDLPYDNTYDVISKVDFVNGEDVVLCREHNSLISVRSLQTNGYICPLCKKELDASTLNIIGVSSSGGSGKEETRRGPSPAPWAWGWGALVMLLCLVVSVVMIFNAFGGGTSASPLETVRVYSPTATRVVKPPTQLPPRPTATKYVSPPLPSSTSSSCSVSVVQSKIPNQGYVLKITPCSGPPYVSDLLPNGVYKVSPNNKFVVYVAADADGSVYISRIGESTIYRLGRLKQDHQFSAFLKNETPSFRLTLTNDNLIIYEEKFQQSASYSIPGKYSR